MATLAEVLRQAGYVTPQGQVTGPRTDLAQKLKSYVMNIPQNAAQNLANQRADIDAALTMGDKGIQIGDRAAFARQMAEVPNLMGLTAYHGTPHTIKGKFDISKVGTGEGAQAYGHGMYFAEAPQVAETYRRAGGGLEVRYPKPLEELGINPKVATNSMDFDENPVNQALGRIAKGLRTTALDYPDVPIDQKLVKEHFDEYIRLLDDKLPAEAAQKKALQDLVSKEGYPEIGFGGNLYKVDIPDEYIPNMLDWDKPMNMQSPQVLKALKIPQEAVDKYNQLSNRMEELQWVRGGLDSPEWNKISEEAKQIRAKYGLHRSGEELYREMATLAKNMGNQEFSKVAAENLKRQGITGIRYLDEGSRGKARNTTSNFVVFDPSEVKILEQNSKPLTRKEIIEQELEKIAK